MGTYEGLATASMETPVIDVIHMLVKKSISSVPILDRDGAVINVFEAVDVIALIKGGVYDDLNLTVGEALLKRSDVSTLIRDRLPVLEKLTLVIGLRGNLHLLSVGPTGHHFRHNTQISRAQTCRHR